MRERLREIIGELRALVDKAQDALDDRPVLQAALDALRAKVDEAKAEKGSGCEA
jgi:signal transduction histidine kinase